MSSPLEQLEQRLLKLEEQNSRLAKSNRVFKTLNISIILVAFCLVAIGWKAQMGTQKIVEAEKFVIVDSLGNERGILGFWGREAKVPMLHFKEDSTSYDKASFTLTASNLSFYNDSVNSIRLGTDWVFSPDKLVGGHFYLPSPRPNPHLYMADALGNNVARLTFNEINTPSLVLLTKDLKSGVKMGVNAVGPAYYLISNEQTRASINLNEEGKPSFQLRDEKGNVRTNIGHLTTESRTSGAEQNWPESSIFLFDAFGRNLWYQPEE